MQFCTLTHLFVSFWILLLFTGCFGGGGGGDGEGNILDNNTIEEITDNRVSTVTLLVTDNFQRANSESPIFLTVIARDNTNAPLSDVEVSLASTSDYAVFITPKGLTEENGRFTTAVVSSVAETFEVMPTAGGKRGEAASVTFIAPVDLIELDASAEVVSLGDSTTITVKIREEFTEDPLPDTPFNVTHSGAAVLNNVPEKTDAHGQATFTVTDNTAETVTITVTSGSLTQKLKLYFGATLELLPSSINALDKATLTVLLKDSNNTPIIGQKIQFNFIGENSETLTPVIALTSENGTAEVTITDLAKDGGVAEVQASSGTLTAQATVTFGQLLIDPRVSAVKLIVTDNFQSANGRDKITITVVVQDTVNAPLSGVSVNLVSTSGFALFEALNGTTGENGRFTTTVTSTIAETFQVISTAGGVQGVPVDVTFAAPVGEIVLRASKNVLPVGKTSTVTLTILRKIELEEILEKFGQFFNSVNLEGATLENLLQQKVLLPKTPFKVTVSGSAVLHDVEDTTNANGQTSFTVTNNKKETVIITVTSGAITRTLPLFFGASLNLLPKSTNAVETAILTALLKDGHDAPIAGQDVTFQFEGNNNETLKPNIATTDTDGTAEVTITDLENNGGKADIKVSSGALSAQASVNFLAAFGENRHLEVKTTSTVLNVNQATTITAHITDKNGFPIPGQRVTFSVAKVGNKDSNAQVSLNTNNTQNSNSVTGISDSQGEIEATISNTSIENVIVTIQADTAKQEIPLYFGANLRLTPAEAHGIADDTTPVTLTATLIDAQGTGISGIPIYFRVTSGQAFLDNFRLQTDELGQAEINVTNDTPGDVIIEAQADTLTQMDFANLIFSPSEPGSLTLEADVTNNNKETILLPLNSEITIIATVNDTQDNPVKNGTRVDFTATGAGTVTEFALTEKGKATAIFSATTQAGISTITATAGTATDNITFTIQPGDAGTIEVHKIEPKVIGIIGSGVTQSTTIEFLVKDSLGNQVADGTDVKFALGKTTLGGGETITTQGLSGTTAIGTTNNGLVSVTLKSGTVAGSIDVIATVNETINTIARITIVSSFPDADHLSLAAEYLNIAGGVKFGLLDKITAFVGDRFGNIVPDGTSVSFITEGGTIGKSIGQEAFTTTTEFGQATAVLQSANPMVPALGGIPTIRKICNEHSSIRGMCYECSGDYALVTDSFHGISLCGNPGLVTIVAFTTGSESFIDVNGNGQFDSGDKHSNPGFIDTNSNQQWDMGEMLTGKGDMSEPYIDGNDNFTFDLDELYIDVNGNHQFDGPDGIFQDNTTVWHSMRVLFSSHTRSEDTGLMVTPTSFLIPTGASQIFIVSNISDIYGNALVKGTKFQVTTNNGRLGGTTDLTFGDSNDRGMPPVIFTLSSNCDNNECPPPSPATITITISSPLSNNAPGGNGAESLVISGVINIPSDTDTELLPN